MSQEHVYTTELGEIGLGRPFMMVNYTGVYIRVKTDRDLNMIHSVWLTEYCFNDDGTHVPVVDLATGRLFHMAKGKPCMVYPGESYR